MSLKWYGKEIEDKIEIATRSGLTAAAITIEGSATRLCKPDTGRLRNSITYTVKKEGERYSAYIGTNVEYAPWVEYGTGIYAEGGKGRKTPWVYFNEKVKHFVKTRGNKPQPFLRRAADENRDDISDIFTAQFRKMLK